MTERRWIVLLVAYTLTASAGNAAVDVEDLRRGLVATYRDPAGAEIVQFDPVMAVALKTDEAAHPRLTVNGGTIRWTGYVYVLRAANYHFRAVLRGGLRLNIAGKDVLAGEVKAPAPSTIEARDVRLEAGAHALVAEFTRLPGSARLELSWQAPHIRTEPLPYDVLFHHPKEVPAQLTADALVEQGRFLAEEYSCTACHAPSPNDRLAKGLLPRKGPDLSQVGGRVRAGWLDRWLEAPHQLRPGAVMPTMFTSDATGLAERRAVAAYLATLGGPFPPTPKQPNARDLTSSIFRGQGLFYTTGCAACHQPPDKSANSDRRWALSSLGSKTTSDKLAAFLRNPLAVDPSGRMPHMQLQNKEADDLANYLCQVKDATITEEVPSLAYGAESIQRGRKLVAERGCVACHTIAPGGKPVASTLVVTAFDTLKDQAKLGQGCLAANGSKRGSAPGFNFDDQQRQALRAFLTSGTKGAGSPAPLHAARVALKRFNCLACHQRDGEGGLSSEIVEELRRYEKAENAEAVSPPPLTGVGHKLRTPWLRQVLTQGGRARPWMGLRMPQFGEAHVGRLPEALAALEGAEPDDKVHNVALTPAKIEAGRLLVGKSAFGCIGCHDLAGVPNHGTRGPDMALMNQRVRYDWYLRWLEQPQRMQPGTRMPQVFTAGRSPLEQVLGGSGDAQAEAMWAYLSLGPGLPLPEGMEPPKGLALTVKDRPVILRTFMPDAGTRAITVGYPGGVSVAFDAEKCRLAYAWTGNYLDAGPVWNDRGGSPAKVLGTRFWTASAVCPWEASASETLPDFSARVSDPAYGAAPPDGQLFTRPREAVFESYTTDSAGVPTFRYRVHPGSPQELVVSERLEPLRSTVAAGLARRFTLDVSRGTTVWFLAGDTAGEPRLFEDGASKPLDVARDSIDLDATKRLLLPQGDRPLVLTVPAPEGGARWRVQRVGTRWQVLLRLPAAEQARRVEIQVNHWAPYRDEPGLLRELAVGR